MVEIDDLDRLEQKFSNRFNSEFDAEFNEYLSETNYNDRPPILLVKKESNRFYNNNHDYKSGSSTYKRKNADDTDSYKDIRNNKITKR